MMHVRVSLITTDPQVLAGCIGYLEAEARPVLASRPGSLGLSLLAGQEGGVAIVESFWATHDAFWLSAEVDALLRGELARRVKRPVTAEVLAEEGCEIRTDEDYSLIFNSARKATVPPE